MAVREPRIDVLPPGAELPLPDNGCFPASVTLLGPDGSQVREVALPREEAVTLYLNGKELVTLLASPGQRRELVAGFLFSEGIVGGQSQLLELEEDAAGVRVKATAVDLPLRLLDRRVVGSGCGRAAGFVTALDAFAAARRRQVAPLPWVSADAVCAAATFTFSHGALYRRTRGTHAAALFDRAGDPVALSEDIGRHNAVDKVLGARLLADEPLDDLFLVVTGRVSSEMVAKAARTSIPLVVSKSVPTDLALRLAERVHLTVAACRGNRQVRVFSHPELVGSWS
jgi:FdhD protein